LVASAVYEVVDGDGGSECFAVIFGLVCIYQPIERSNPSCLCMSPGIDVSEISPSIPLIPLESDRNLAAATRSTGHVFFSFSGFAQSPTSVAPDGLTNGAWPGPILTDHVRRGTIVT
jgi:hypothetical protein